MKIVFFGTSAFAVPALISLKNSEHKLSAVVTQPDRRSGRGLVKTFSPVKLTARNYALPVYQTANTGAGDFIKKITGLKPDLFVTASFGQILPREVLEIPKKYPINIHASLLPKYRGAAPINWAIINGEKNTGITIFKMTEKMDAGPVILEKEIPISESDNAYTVNDKLSKASAALIIEALNLVEEDKVNFITQKEADVSFAPRLKKEDGLLSWNETSEKIHNLVRGLVPWPSAYTYLENRLIKIWATKSEPYNKITAVEPGTIIDIDKVGIHVRTGDGSIIICEVQAEAGKRMAVEAYCRGHKVQAGERFSASFS